MSANRPAGATRQLNRAEVVDNNFRAFVRQLEQQPPAAKAWEYELSEENFLGLFDSQLRSRQMDLMARKLRLENKVFYTIGSSGHEGNALLGLHSRVSDPAFLHYRSGGFMAERSRQAGRDFIRETALSFAASAEDPASGGRHKVWGSKPMWVIPQTSTIASHLPKAVGCALAIASAKGIGHRLPVPDDSLVLCSFGDASLNHSTAQGALNSAQWTAHQGLPLPLVFVCEDNGIGISVKTPSEWVAKSVAQRHGLHYVAADGLDLINGSIRVAEALQWCRKRRQPVFLHLRTTRLMGHAGTDFEIEYRDEAELSRAEAMDPLLTSARQAVEHGLMSPQDVLDTYQQFAERCIDETYTADRKPRLTSLASVRAPLAPLDTKAVLAEAKRVDLEQRKAFFGNSKRLPENQGAKHMAININRALTDLMDKYPQALLFGEDVAQKGGVYTLTKGLFKRFGGRRVFNTLLDEQTILGLAQGFAAMGCLPIPEIQYLAYFHNACDQIRGEACSTQFFSNGQFANPMVVRIAGLGYQKGFGGHFHNDNSIAALRDIPGLAVACPSRGDDAAMMLRTLTAMAQVNQRVSVFLEPIALYMTKDLFEEGDNAWCFDYPAPEQAIAPGEPRVYYPGASDVLIITYGNGVHMGLRAAKRVDPDAKHIRIMDLRWLQPLNAEAIAEQAQGCDSVLVVDEGRFSAGPGEGVITALVEAGLGGKPISRIVGADCYTPLGAAAGLVLPSEDDIVKRLQEMLD
jgi:2-oxoisovalerate dehydrogenase E1 component